MYELGVARLFGQLVIKVCRLFWFEGNWQQHEIEFLVLDWWPQLQVSWVVPVGFVASFTQQQGICWI